MSRGQTIEQARFFRYLKVAGLLVVIYVAIIIGYKYTGFGKLSIIPSNAFVHLEGTPKGSVSSLKLRPGTYQIDVVSPAYRYDGAVSVKPFMTTTIRLKKTSWNELIAAQLTDSRAFKISKVMFFDNRWLVGEVSNEDGVIAVVMYFYKGVWNRVGVYPIGGDNLQNPDLINLLRYKLPPFVYDYIKTEMMP